MTPQEDRKNAVYTIQVWLSALYNSGMPIPYVVPDGIYGSQTADTVRIYQGLKDLPQTGRVNLETWDSLKNAYDAALEKVALSEAIRPFETILKNSILSLNDASGLVYIVQVMLETLMLVYTGLEEQKITGVYDPATERNVQYLQSVWQLPRTGNLDVTTWNKLATAYNRSLNRE